MPHYDRNSSPAAPQNELQSASDGAIDENAMEGAAEALREVEVEAVQPEPETPDISELRAEDLAAMNIDELRVIAKQLDIPNRATITEQDDLIAAIKQCL